MAANPTVPASFATNAYKTTGAMDVVVDNRGGVGQEAGGMPSFSDVVKSTQGQSFTQAVSATSQAPAAVQMPSMVADTMNILRQADTVARQAALGQADQLAATKAFSDAQIAFKTTQTLVSETVKSLKEIMNMTA